MFGKKRHVRSDGAQAIGVVTDVGYAKVLGGMTVARNDNYKLELTLMVRPDDDAAPFEAKLSAYFAQFAQPSVGDQLYLRYDPEDRTRIEIDTARIEAQNAAAQAQLQEAAAGQLPADLASHGISGRASLADVQQTPAGPLVDCHVTVNVRLIDGTPPYKASCHAMLGPENAAKLIPGQTFVTVRADPTNHQRIALSLSEPTPVVTITDAAVLEPVARALREGAACQVTLVLAGRQFLKTPEGDELYAVKLRVDGEAEEFQVFAPVPAAGVGLMVPGTALPARRIALEPTVVAIDWPRALAALGDALSAA